MSMIKNLFTYRRGSRDRRSAEDHQKKGVESELEKMTRSQKRARDKVRRSLKRSLQNDNAAEDVSVKESPTDADDEMEVEEEELRPSKTKRGRGHDREDKAGPDSINNDKVEEVEKKEEKSEAEPVENVEQSEEEAQEEAAEELEEEAEQEADEDEELPNEEGNNEGEPGEEEEEDQEDDQEEEKNEDKDEEEEEDEEEEKSVAEKNENGEMACPSSGGTPRKSPSPDDDLLDDATHPYVGKRVKLIDGAEKGMVTVLLGVRSRGWWELDGIEGNVHSRRCVLVDKVEEKDMIAYYQKRGRKYRGTPVLSKHSKRTSEPVEMMEGAAGARTMRALGAGHESRKRKLQAPLLMSDLVDKAEPTAESMFCEDDDLLQDSNLAPEPWILPPIVLEPDHSLPSALRHLDPTHLLEVFDRKSGTILDERVSVQHLPDLLRHHAEYEPIIPAREYDERLNVRRGRSASNILVSSTVRPQTSVEFERSVYVVVTMGPHRGKHGIIRASLPGGWCLVEGVLGNGTPMVMSPAIIEKRSFRQPQYQVHLNRGNAQNGKQPASPSEHDVGTLGNTFKVAIGETVRADSKVTKTQLEALRFDKANLETQLAALVDSDVPDRKRLQKRLDYLNSCLEKAECDGKAEAQSAIMAQAIADSAFRHEQAREYQEDKKNLRR